MITIENNRFQLIVMSISVFINSWIIIWILQKMYYWFELLNYFHYYQMNSRICKWMNILLQKTSNRSNTIRRTLIIAHVAVPSVTFTALHPNASKWSSHIQNYKKRVFQKGSFSWKKQSEKNTIKVGLEPTTSGSEVQRAIHCATWPDQPTSSPPA